MALRPNRRVGIPNHLAKNISVRVHQTKWKRVRDFTIQNKISMAEFLELAVDEKLDREESK